jgi:hypothetical protein
MTITWREAKTKNTHMYTQETQEQAYQQVDCRTVTVYGSATT